MVTPIQIFEAGSQTDGRGVTRDFPVEVLDQIVETYDPKTHEAPILINHNETGPNFGLWQSVYRAGKRLFGIPHKVDQAFAESVNSGRWPKLSVGLYSPNDAANPYPGKWSLREVSAVQIPGVKGMLSPIFSEQAIPDVPATTEFTVHIDIGEPVVTGGLAIVPTEPSPVVTPTFQEAMKTAKEAIQMARDNGYSMSEIASAFNISAENLGQIQSGSMDPPEGFMDTIKSKMGKKKAAFSEPAPSAPIVASVPTDVQFAERERKLDDLQRRLEVQQAEMQLQQAALSRRASDVSFVEKLVDEGKITSPERKQMAIGLMQSMPTAGVAFSEASGDLSPHQLLKKFLASLSPTVEYSEKSAPGVSPAQGGKGGYSPEALATRAKAYQTEQEAKGNTVQFHEAVRFVADSLGVE